MKEEIEKLGLTAVALAKAPDVPKHLVDLPRTAMFSTWGSTQDVGWVRYAFDQFELQYDLIYKERIRKGNLRADYDVIVIPSQGRGGGAKGLINDIDSRNGRKLCLQQGRRTSLARRLRRIGRHLGRHGPRGRRRTGQVREPGRRADHPGGFQLPAGRLRTLAQHQCRPAPPPQFYAPGPIVEAEITKPEPSDLLRISRRPPFRSGGPAVRC